MKENENDYLYSMNEKIYAQLSYAEAKHAVLIGLVGAALFALIGIIIDIKDCNLCWLQIILGIMSISMLITLIVSLSSFYPCNKTLNRDRKCNLFYYGDLAKLNTGTDYFEIVNGSEDSTTQLAEQNILISKVIVKKHNRFIIALNLLIASIVLPYYLVLAVIFFINLYKKEKNKHDLPNS